MRQILAILGSTGSIGTQTLEVVRRNPEMFEVYALTAGRQVDLLIKQAIEFQPEVVAIADETQYDYLKNSLAKYPIKVFAGEQSIAEVAMMQPITTVVTAMVGYSGLLPTINAIKAKKKIALANKETLVVAGELVTELAIENKVDILPIDSEHSAIFQCLVGENEESIEKLILTASGGPFRKASIDELERVTAKDALRHPTWQMGAKITIDSATMMNKGFEVIEAKWLFGVGLDRIDVVVHPQSIIHSMVQFRDGSLKAQLGSPDMKHPIQYALTFPQRLPSEVSRVSLPNIATLTFEEPDIERFRNLDLAYEASLKGGNMPCVLNAANEVVVAEFLKGRIGFLQMSQIIERVLEESYFVNKPTIEDYIQCDKLTRIKTLEMI